MNDPVFQTEKLSVTYGGLAAVSDVSLEIGAGSLAGLIGPNGAGKTTFVDAVTGMTPSAGRIWFDGNRIDRVPAYRRIRAGMARTFQSLELFEELTVRENLTVVAEPARWYSPVKDLVRPQPSHDAQRAVTEALELVNLRDYADALPAELSLGQRKLVTVARALSTRPTLALLDEPAAGLDSEESLALGETLKSIVAAGTSILIIDHDMGLVLGVCEQIYVLEFGRLIASGAPDEIRGDSHVVAAYLGAGDGDLMDAGAR